MSARITVIADAVVANIQALWGPTPPDAVQRIYEDPQWQEGTNAMQGRQVLVYASTFSNPERATRAQDWREYKVQILVLERYTDTAGPVPREWVDERVEFVEQTIWTPIKDRSQGPISPGVVPWPPVEVIVCDPDKLRQLKLFRSLVMATFREIL